MTNEEYLKMIKSHNVTMIVLCIVICIIVGLCSYVSGKQSVIDDICKTTLLDRCVPVTFTLK